MDLMVMDLANIHKLRSIIFYALYFLPFVFLYNCSAYDKASQFNSIGYENSYVKYYNDTLGIQMLAFGDFKFANNQNEYKEISADNKYNSRKRILFASTKNPSYFFNISINNSNSTKLPNSKSITCNKNNYILLVSPKAPKNDADFLLKNFKCIK